LTHLYEINNIQKKMENSIGLIADRLTLEFPILIDYFISRP